MGDINFLRAEDKKLPPTLPGSRLARALYVANWAKISFASSSVSLLPMSYQVPVI